jgi:hypothetical protein
MLWIAIGESEALLRTGKFDGAAEVGLRGQQVVRRTGRQASQAASVLAANGRRRCSPAGVRPKRQA